MTSARLKTTSRGLCFDCPNSKAWNNSLIESLFQAPQADTIKKTPIINSNEDDLLCWKLTPPGKCNTKRAYKACLHNLQEWGEQRPMQVQQDYTVAQDDLEEQRLFHQEYRPLDGDF